MWNIFGTSGTIYGTCDLVLVTCPRNGLREHLSWCYLEKIRLNRKKSGYLWDIYGTCGTNMGLRGYDGTFGTLVHVGHFLFKINVRKLAAQTPMHVPIDVFNFK